MRVRSVVPWIAVFGTLTGLSSRAAVGQELTLAPRTPRFFYASSTAAKPVEIDVSRSMVLGRVVSLHLNRATIGGLLAEIQRQTGLTFAYDPQFPATRPVTLEAESITVAASLGAILVGTGVDVVLTPTGHVWLTGSEAGTPHVQEGSIVGRVTDNETDAPLVGATVTLELPRRTATTDTDGYYRFPNLTAGDYMLRARYIGYGALVVPVAVSEGQEVTVDFPMLKSAQMLDEVVTTGTMVPTEVRALPTPVSVIGEREIALQRPSNVQELFRQAVPTAVSWDLPHVPYSTSFSVRGANTLDPSRSQMKVFVDGLEVASAGGTPIDLSSVERVEVIRGPQAATIYGSDAIGGVIQIFTKRGNLGLGRPALNAQVELGVVQTPYVGHGDVLRQRYAAAVRGGGTNASYNFGGSYSHTGEYIPNSEISEQSNPSVYGGMRFTRGIIIAEVAGRYYTQNAPNVLNPALLESGFGPFSRPNYTPNQLTNQTFSARFNVAPTAFWSNTLIMGVDRLTGENAQTRPRLTNPGDTLLSMFVSSQTKTSVAYNTSVHTSLGSDLSGSLTGGLDHYYRPFSSWTTSEALNTTGAVTIAPGGSISASRGSVTNTGYFTQAQLAIRDALFLTAGLRAEQNSEFGDSLGTPLSPRVGVSYARSLGGTTVKLRGSWGRAIRAPSPGQKFASIAASNVTLAAPDLGPERQKGWDAGVDVAFGVGGRLSVSYYDQIAEDLIDYVQVAATPTLAYQYQNVGRVKNTGAEIEGVVSLGPLQVRGQYGYARSRVEQLAPGYVGDLLVGDQTLATPRHTAGGSITVSPLRGTTVTGALTYLGGFRQYDFLGLFRCFGGTGPCQAVNRDYIIEYPGFVKLNANVSQRISSVISGVVAVGNLTNNKSYELSNLNPVMGRITTIGLQFNY